MGRDSSVDTATRYGLDGPGIESSGQELSPHPIPVAERSKARVCGLSLAGIACSNSAGDMDVRVVKSGQKTQSQDNHDKTVQSTYRERTKKKKQIPLVARFCAPVQTGTGIHPPPIK